jgi:alanyl-tRNA synthetase
LRALRLCENLNLSGNDEMTVKLYLEDPYRQNFSSKVIEQTEINGKPGIVLEQTLFYPTSGGQPHDTGTLNDIPVIDVYENESRRVVHLLKRPLAGSAVEGRINWQRRFDHMQQHTGQHLLSQAFIKICNAETLSFHLGDESCTLDVNRAGLGSETIAAVEDLANQIVCQNREVIGHTVPKSELERYPVRKPPSVEENIRIIEIKDFDYSPCGGTHCSGTGEIGIIKISRHENYKGGSRIHFLCGFRALKHYQNKSAILKQIGDSMSSGEGDLPPNIQKMQDELKHLRWDNTHLKKQLMSYEARDLISECQKLGDINVVEKIFKDRNPQELKILAQSVLENLPNAVVFFGSKADGKASLFFLRSEELDLDMAKLMQNACAVINGRGGGRPQQAQGGGSAVDKLEDALRCAHELLSNLVAAKRQA